MNSHKKTDARQNRKPMQPVSQGRQFAYRILCSILQQGEYPSLSIDRYLRASNIPPIEKRLCTRLVYTVLDNLIQIDYILSQYLPDASGLDGGLMNILRLGVCQIFYMDRIPDSAAVDESVKMAKRDFPVQFSSLVNGVLRNIIRTRDKISWPSEDQPVRYLSVMDSIPEWFAQALMDDYGFDTAHRIASFRGEHGITLRPNGLVYSDSLSFETVLNRKNWVYSKSELWNAWIVSGITNLARDPDYLQGRYSAEGISSMIAAEAVGAKPGGNYLDCCAAPGGKTAYMAEKMKNSGRIIAWDIHPHRVELIQAAARRLKLDNIRAYQHDAEDFREDYEQYFDGVLLDAPCTGTGVIDNKPDIKSNLTMDQLNGLAQIQSRLLDVCSRYVKQGGSLVYSTCSVLNKEGKRQIERFLKEHREYEIDPDSSFLPSELRSLYSDHGIQILNGQFPYLDGFFIAKLHRI